MFVWTTVGYTSDTVYFSFLSIPLDINGDVDTQIVRQNTLDCSQNYTTGIANFVICIIISIFISLSTSTAFFSFYQIVVNDRNARKTQGRYCVDLKVGFSFFVPQGWLYCIDRCEILMRKTHQIPHQIPRRSIWRLWFSMP